MTAFSVYSSLKKSLGLLRLGLPVALLVLCVLCTVVFTGCFGGGDDADKEGDDAAHAEAASHGSDSHGDDGGDEDDEEGDEEDAGESASHHDGPPLPPSELDKKRNTAWTPVVFNLPAKAKITGWLATPALQAAALAEKHASDDDEEDDDEDDEETVSLPEKRQPLVVLLHGLNGNYQDWAALPWRLIEKGYAVLSIDMRGHGQSRQGGLMGKQDWRQFDQQDWQQLPKDMVNIIRQIRQADTEAGKQGLDAITVGGEKPLPSPLLNYLDVDPQRMTVVGAGIGANVAVKAIRQLAGPPQPEKLQGLVLLSPTLGYKGIRTLEEAFFIDSSALLVASKSDSASYEASQMLYRMLSGEKSLDIYQSIGHGTDMVQFFPELQDKIVSWILTVMPPEATPVPAGFTIVAQEDEDDEE